MSEHPGQDTVQVSTLCALGDGGCYTHNNLHTKGSLTAPLCTKVQDTPVKVETKTFNDEGRNGVRVTQNRKRT